MLTGGVRVVEYSSLAGGLQTLGFLIIDLYLDRIDYRS